MKAIPFPLLRTIGQKRQVLAIVGMMSALVMLTFWLYAPTRNYEFVNWDDPWYVLKNPLIQSWSLANLKSIVTESAVRNYAPLTIFSLLIDHTFWGDWAGGYHLTNLLLHVAGAVLVFFLLRQLTGRADLAIATAVLFAVHPVHVESVAWVSSRKGLLSAVFILASLLCWLKKERSPKSEVCGILFLILALLSKAIAVVVPAIVLCYDVFVQRDRFSDALVKQIIPGFLCLWLLLKTMAAQVTMTGGLRGHYELNLLQILAVDLVILWRYVGMLLCPQDLCVLYNPATSGIWPQVLAAGAAWGAVCWWLWSNRHRRPLVFVAAASWILLLIPVLNLFPITTLMNDRYLYLPSIPALALLVASGRYIVKIFAERTTPLVGGALGLILMLLVTAGFIERTRSYLPVWRNDLALWQHAARQVPELAVVQYQLADALHKAGKEDAALDALDYALHHCNPDEIDRKRIRAKQEELRGEETD